MELPNLSPAVEQPSSPSRPLPHYLMMLVMQLLLVFDNAVGNQAMTNVVQLLLP